MIIIYTSHFLKYYPYHSLAAELGLLKMPLNIQIPNQLVIFFLKCKYYHFGCLQFSLQITKCLKNEFMFLKCQNKESAPFITEIILRRIRATVIDAS